MPTIDEARTLVQKGVPYKIAVNTDPVAAPATVTSSQVSTANATAPSATYTQAEAQAAVTLANDLKTKLNQAQTDISNLRGTVNNLMTALKKNGTIL